MDNKKIVLVIEDESLLLQAISKKLKLNNYEVVSCTNGKQAIDYLSSLAVLPNVIWLDYYLPDMSGIDFVKTIKEQEKWKNIPIMVVSNSASEDKVHNILTLGVNKYILKAEKRLDDIINDMQTLINSS